MGISILLVILASAITIFAVYKIITMIKVMPKWSVNHSERIGTITVSILFLIVIALIWTLIPIRTERKIFDKNSRIMITRTTIIETYCISGKDTLLITSVPQTDTIAAIQKPDSVYLESETMYTIYGQVFSKQIKNYSINK